MSSTADSKQNASNYVIASNYEAIPDAVIDKIFNNNTGERLVEPKPEPSNLESLFPSSSNKLKQYFSPPVTPSSPPKEMFRKADNKSQEAANVTSDRKEDGKTDDVVSHAKKGKDLINKGTVSVKPLFSFVKASAGILMSAVLDLVKL